MRWGLIILFMLVYAFSYEQSRLDLEKQRQKIIQDIERTTHELRSNQKLKETQILQLKTIEEQVSSRKKLIANLNQEVEVNTQIILANQTKLGELASKHKELQKGYAVLIRQSYLKKQSTSKWSYLLSADNLNEFLLRWRYMSQFDEFAKHKSEELKRLTEQIKHANAEIEEAKNRTLRAIDANAENMTKLQEEQKIKDGLIQKLSKEELSLKDKLAKREKERENLNNAIEKIIRAELAKAKEAEAANASVTSKREADNSGFANNKGRLSYPIKTGKITSKFGNQPHPTIKGVEISNNGIDFSTSVPEDVLCVYEGEVVGVTNVPGFKNMIIIKHGSYYTVYSKLENTYVTKGEKVNQNQKIGRIEQEENGQVELHFELWKDKNKLNPQSWFR
jgi:septal ring factor EnvC (AmiA/AmiB activator)